MSEGGSDRGTDRRPAAVFAPEVQDRERFRTADDPSVRAAAFRADLALGGRNLGSAGPLGTPLCLHGFLLHRCNAHHIGNHRRCARFLHTLSRKSAQARPYGTAELWVAPSLYKTRDRRLGIRPQGTEVFFREKDLRSAEGLFSGLDSSWTPVCTVEAGGFRDGHTSRQADDLVHHRARGDRRDRADACRALKKVAGTFPEKCQPPFCTIKTSRLASARE
jgi:hypothetical protein